VPFGVRRSRGHGGGFRMLRRKILWRWIFFTCVLGIDCDNIGSSGFTSIGELGSKCNANGG